MEGLHLECPKAAGNSDLRQTHREEAGHYSPAGSPGGATASRSFRRQALSRYAGKRV